ncbi:MAG: S8 family serine peptidase, partial [Actinobacteria bacterium]|nr:S8 family serine peptidase [Actinomycetota bacterium]
MNVYEQRRRAGWPRKGVLAAAVLLGAPLAVVAPATGTAARMDVAANGAPSVNLGLSASMSGGAQPASARYIVRFATDQALAAAVALQRGARRPAERVWTHRLKGFAGSLSTADLRRLRADPAVMSIEVDSPVSVAGSESSPPWGLDRIDQRQQPLDHTYSYGSTGSGVAAYIIDTGARLTHSEFAARIIRSAWIDFGDGSQAEDCNGHGTHVTGIVGGATYGVAKDVSLIPVKVLTCNGTGLSSDIVTALEWIVNDHLPGVPAVVNMSLGGDPSTALDAAVNDVIADGVTVVVAAGNDSNDGCLHSPARVPAAITVGATTSIDSVASYSNHGSCVDLFAPGSQILSSWYVDGLSQPSDTATKTISGTSMATPHVTGAIARILQDAPAASPAQAWSLLDAFTTTGVLTGLAPGDPDKMLFLAPPPAGPVADFTPVEPARVFDTRPGEAQGVVAVVKQRYSGGNVLHVQVTGAGGVPLAGVGAVSLNVTVSGALAPGFVTVFPCGVQPTVSSLNYVAAQIVPNAVIAPVSATGEVCFFSSADAFLFADVNGWFALGAGFTPVEPARVFDTRPSEAQGVVPVVKQRYSGGNVLHVQVTGAGGVPLAGVGAVSLNVTVA